MIKRLIYGSLVFLLMLFNFSRCEKESIEACNVKDPIKNLQWLAEIVDELESFNDVEYEVYLVRFTDRDLILVNNAINWSIGSNIYYDCEGTYLCGKLTTTGSEECDFSPSDAIQKTLLWSSR